MGWGVEESPQIEDIVSSDSMARGAKRLNDSPGASCLFGFSAQNQLQLPVDLKRCLLATFADPLELITINFLNGDQPGKGDMLIKEGRSSAFLFAGKRGSPTSCLRARLLCHIG
ncbi:hypothetical protein PoB_005527000 [Plakobranchus ocellatus]|uniref:Uncharacterized protein n=1 Tax=Plakobranchus ocellatus TaxID=259542 RepID=A0AAV4C7S6_9GAST|nr:hypothetical protein PoB_005527000 [Plakobranchus ocellatus]